jgi:hypothetical protein
MGRAAWHGIEAWLRVQGEDAHAVKKIGRVHAGGAALVEGATGAVCAWKHKRIRPSPNGRRVTTATGLVAGLRRIENAMFMEAGPHSGGRIGGNRGDVKVRGGHENL